MFEVIAPSLGQSGAPIKLETWFVKEGDKIAAGEDLYEMSNEKLSQEVQSTVSGTVVKINVPEGGEAAPGSVLAEIQED